MSDFVCKLNGKDSRKTWGVVFGEGSLSALQAPPSMKTPITNESRLLNGKETLRINKFADRDVSLTFYLCASSYEEYVSRLNAFVTELSEGTTILESKFEPGVKYRLDYQSCTNYKSYNGTMAKFVIKFNEPDPTYRK